MQDPKRSDFVTKFEWRKSALDSQLNSPARSEAKSASPLDWLLNPAKDIAAREVPLDLASREQIYDRILSRLIAAEAHEPDVSLRDDYRIAFLIVRLCQTGEATYCTPHVLACFKVLGCHPDHVWPRILARRKAMLGPTGEETQPPLPARSKRPSPVLNFPKKEIA